LLFPCRSASWAYGLYRQPQQLWGFLQLPALLSQKRDPWTDTARVSQHRAKVIDKSAVLRFKDETRANDARAHKSPDMAGGPMDFHPIEPRRGVRIRSTQDLAAGLFMIAFAGLALLFTTELPLGSWRQMGPGMLPVTFAVICALLGLLVVVNSLRYDGEKLSGWSWRGVLFVLGGACLFGLTVRGFELGPIKVPQLGMLVAGPLVVLVGGFAAEDVRWKELVIFAAVMTAFCAFLFKYALGLPIPLAPWLIGI
jgi:hypothetical protein